MKSFRTIVSEVAQPKAGDEKHFKDKHIVAKVDYPVDVEVQFTGGKIAKAPKRKADLEAGEDEQVYEAMDPVNKKAAMGKFKNRPDKDIDNDGDVDSSDKYLHARRNAITKAIHKEEAEELDEISRDLARSYIRKASSDNKERKADVMKPFPLKDMEKNVSQFKKMKTREKGIETAGKKAYGIGGKAKVSATESVELDEKLKASDDMGDWVKDFQDSDAPQFKGKSKEKRRQMAVAAKLDAEREAGMRKEEVEQIDEISKKTLGSYVKKASSDMANNAYALGARDPLKKPGSWDKAFKRNSGIKKAIDRLTKEEAEQLDELSPNTLHSYIKKAAGNMAGNAAVAAAQASSSMKKSSPDVKRKIKNRMQGITGASGRLADKANMAENWQEEIPMMMRQLEFIIYAAEEIMDYIEMAGDPEEWFQNKISGIHNSMLSMYAYAQGGRRAGYGFDESVELGEELKGSQHKIDANKNGKIDAHDFKLLRKKKMKEEVEDLEESITKMSDARLKFHATKNVPHGSFSNSEIADEHDRRKKTDPNYHKVKPSLNEVTRSAIKKTVTYTDSQGHSKTKNVPIKKVDSDEHGEEKIKESVEILDEAFKAGMVKLKDGGSVVLKKEDADLLNKMFKDLSSANRKKMQEVAMKDKNGFEEILGFAREAL